MCLYFWWGYFFVLNMLDIFWTVEGIAGSASYYRMTKVTLSQKDGTGKKKDTYHTQDDDKKPFRTLRDAEAHRKKYIDEIKSRTERSVNVPKLFTLQEIFDDYIKNRGATLAPNTISKYQGKEVLENRVDGGAVHGGNFVLRDERGELITHSKAGHVRERIQKRSGEHFYFHGLRHTVVSRLADAGVPLKNVSAFIGHADTRTTEQYYLGLDELGESKLVSAIQNL